MDHTKPEPPSTPDLDMTAAERADGGEYFGQPFSKWWPIAAGVLVGIALRLTFYGAPGAANSAMSGAFLHFAPLAVGAITVYFAERQRRRRWWYYLLAPMVATGLFVLGTLLIMVEGLICAIIIVPYFALYGAAGGLVMGIICRLTKWPKPAAYCFSILPLMIAAVPDMSPDANQFSAVERSTIIDVPANRIWDQIHSTQDIQPHEVSQGWMYRIGVPLPIAGVTVATPQESVRKITMGKNIHFDQVVSEWRPNEYVRWTYRFTEDSFPPKALDDHVRIGGQYFDMVDTSYSLAPHSPNRTVLTIRMNYRVTTDFNWYANRVATLLIGNFEETILRFYKNRAESTAVANPALTPKPST